MDLKPISLGIYGILEKRGNYFFGQGSKQSIATGVAEFLFVSQCTEEELIKLESIKDEEWHSRVKAVQFATHISLLGPVASHVHQELNMISGNMVEVDNNGGAGETATNQAG